MRRQRVPMCTAIRDTMPPHTVVLYICCSILLLPYSAQAFNDEPVICVGQLGHSCETRLCFDSVDVEKGTIDSGCASKNMCVEPGCDMIGSKFICCCEHSVCNGKSEGLIRSRLRMWKSGHYVSRSAFTSSQKTSAEDMERLRLKNVRNVALPPHNENQSLTQNNSQEDAQETTTVSEQLTTVNQEHAEITDANEHIDRENTMTTAEGSTAASTNEPSDSGVEDAENTAEPSTTPFGTRSADHHTSSTLTEISEELSTFSDGGGSTPSSTTEAEAPQEDELTSSSELNDQHFSVTTAQPEGIDVTQSHSVSTERPISSSEQESVEENTLSPAEDGLVDNWKSLAEHEEEGEEEQWATTFEKETEYLITPAEGKESWHPTTETEIEENGSYTTRDQEDSAERVQTEDDSVEHTTTAEQREVSTTAEAHRTSPSSVELLREKEIEFLKESDIDEDELDEVGFTTETALTSSATRKIIIDEMSGMKDDISYEEEGEMSVTEEEERMMSTTESTTSERTTISITHYDAKIVTIPAHPDSSDSEEMPHEGFSSEQTTPSTLSEPATTEEMSEEMFTEEQRHEEIVDDNTKHSAEFDPDEEVEQFVKDSMELTYTQHPKHISEHVDQTTINSMELTYTQNPKHISEHVDQTTINQHTVESTVNEGYTRSETDEPESAENISKEHKESAGSDDEIDGNYVGELRKSSASTAATVHPTEPALLDEHISTLDRNSFAALPPHIHEEEAKIEMLDEDEPEATTMKTIAETIAVREELFTTEGVQSTRGQPSRAHTTIRVPYHRTTPSPLERRTIEKEEISTKKYSRKTKRIYEEEKPRGALLPWWLFVIGGLLTASIIAGITYKLITHRRKPGRRTATTTATGQEMIPLKKSDEEKGLHADTEA